MGAANVDELVKALTSDDIKDPMKFASSFIIRLLEPVKKLDGAQLKELYNASQKVIESL